LGSTTQSFLSAHTRPIQKEYARIYRLLGKCDLRTSCTLHRAASNHRQRTRAAPPTPASSRAPESCCSARATSAGRMKECVQGRLSVIWSTCCCQWNSSPKDTRNTQRSPACSGRCVCVCVCVCVERTRCANKSTLACRTFNFRVS